MRNYAGLDNASLNELCHEQAEKIKRLEAEVERLQQQVEKMKNCGNCKWFQDEGDCVNPKNTEQDCEYYRGFFWEMED